MRLPERRRQGDTIANYGYIDHYRITIDDTTRIFHFLPLTLYIYIQIHIPNPPFCPHCTSCRSSPLQVPPSFTTKYPHNPKPNIKKPQRIRHQAPHTPHAPHSAKHLTTTIRTPHNRQRTQHIPHRRIHRQQHPYETSQYER